MLQKLGLFEPFCGGLPKFDPLSAPTSVLRHGRNILIPTPVYDLAYLSNSLKCFPGNNCLLSYRQGLS